MKKSSGKNWIQKAIKKPGSLTAAAKKAGAITKKGDISKSWIEGQSKKPGKIGQRARFAKTLAKLRKKKK